MPTLAPYKELDLTGLAPDNLITNELHTLVVSQQRLLVPIYGSFFKEGLSLREVGGVGTLSDDKYICMDFNQSVGLETGKDVFECILITDPTVSDQIEITYQCLGGPHSRNRQVLIDWLADRNITAAVADWGDLIDVPQKFRAQPEHKHLFRDFFGMEYITKGLDRVKSGLEIGSNPVYNRLITSFDTKKQTLLGMVDPAITAELNNRFNSFAMFTNKASIALGDLENIGVMTVEKGRAVAEPTYEVRDEVEEHYLTTHALNSFKNNMTNRLVVASQTNLGLNYGVITTPTRGDLLVMKLGAVQTWPSKKQAVESGMELDLSVYPENFDENSQLIVLRSSSNETDNGGVWMGFDSVNRRTYVAHLESDAGNERITWKKLLISGDLDEIRKLTSQHVVDGKNSHEVSARQAGLGQVENLPIVTEDEIIAKKSSKKYLTFDGLQYFMKAFMTNAVPPAAPGTTLDPNAITMDQTQIIFTKCKDAGSSGGVTVGAPIQSKGLLTKSFCDGSDKFGRYSDGAGGFYDQIIELNSDDCKFTKLPDKNTLVGNFCSGKNKVARYNDGLGGFYDIVVEMNAAACNGAPTLSPTPSISEVITTAAGRSLALTTNFTTAQAGTNGTFSFTLNGFTANTTVSVEVVAIVTGVIANGTSTVERVLNTLSVATGGNGNATVNSTFTGNYSLPNGTYELWVRTTNSGVTTESNRRPFTVQTAGTATTAAPTTTAAGRKMTLSISGTTTNPETSLPSQLVFQGFTPNSNITVVLRALFIGVVTGGTSTEGLPLMSFNVIIGSDGSGTVNRGINGIYTMNQNGPYEIWATTVESGVNVASNRKTITVSTSGTTTPAPTTTAAPKVVTLTTSLAVVNELSLVPMTFALSGYPANVTVDIDLRALFTGVVVGGTSTAGTSIQTFSVLTSSTGTVSVTRNFVATQSLSNGTYELWAKATYNGVTTESNRKAFAVQTITTAPPTTTPAPTTTVPPTTTPAGPYVMYSSDKTTIRFGDTETRTVKITGMRPMTRLTIQIYNRSPLVGSGLPAIETTLAVYADGTGKYTLTYPKTDNGIQPAGTYDSWVIVKDGTTSILNYTSNQITRTFVR